MTRTSPSQRAILPTHVSQLDSPRPREHDLDADFLDPSTCASAFHLVGDEQGASKYFDTVTVSRGATGMRELQGLQRLIGTVITVLLTKRSAPS